MSCIVPNCRITLRSAKKFGENISFHRFPRNYLRQKWIDTIGRHNWTPADHHRICSKHFRSNYFVTSNNRILLATAIPTIFERAVEMPLTTAERQRKYREKLKLENPDKYEEYKKKTAERAKLYYREKVTSQCTDEEKEKRRRQWRNNEERTCAPEKQRPLTTAERQRKYREKLKKENPDKYEEYKKKTAERAKLYYREKASQYTDEEKEKRRQQWRNDEERTCAPEKQRPLTTAERQRKYREKLKMEIPDKYEEYKKKVAERAKRYYRDKASQYTDEEREKRRLQQRNARKLSSAETQKNCKESKIDNPDEYGEIKKNGKNYKCYKEITTRKEVLKQIRKKLTSAERQKRYRDKLKRENPEKYLVIKKKVAEKAKEYYREKVSLSTDEHGKSQWNVRGKRVSSSERVKRYRERLRRENPAKYAEMMKKSAEHSKHYYREKAKLYTEEEKEKRRQIWREARRMNKMRKQKRQKHKLVDNGKNADEESSSEQDAQPGPSETPFTPPWHDPASPSVSDRSQQQDPLRGLTDQCRFCGEFSKDCIVVSSHTPYLAGDKTTLALNHITIQLDFNEDLQNTVCKDCDSKLKQFSDFVKLVKDAQDSINGKIKTEDVRETDVYIKTEVPEDDGNSISIGDTVFLKNTITNKRKSDDINQKKIKVSKPDVMVECVSEVLIDIKQEIDDDDIHTESSRLSDEGSDTLSIPEEMKNAYASDTGTAGTFSVTEVIKKEIKKK